MKWGLVMLLGTCFSTRLRFQLRVKAFILPCLVRHVFPNLHRYIYRPLRGFYGNYSMRIPRIYELGKMSKSCSQSLKLYQFVCILPFQITFCQRNSLYQLTYHRKEVRETTDMYTRNSLSTRITFGSLLQSFTILLPNGHTQS